MSPSRIFILRPVATSLLMAGILLVGAVAFRQLPVSALPEVDYPTIQVLTFYPGASPDVMASSVTAPLEKQLGQMPGLQQMTSTSSDGSSLIILQFTLSLNIDVAEQEVQQSINAAATYLPADLPTPPVYSKINPADTPILTLALTSSSLPLPQVEDLADTHLAPKISQLPGVGLVSISGGQKPAVRIQANPTALSSYGLNMEDLRTAITAANVNQAKGNFDGPHQAYTIGANDQLLSSSDYAGLIVAYRNGAPVKMTDVATVADETENVRQAAWMNQTPAVIMNIQRQPGANIIAVADSIKRLLPVLGASLPASVRVSILTDLTTTIRASVRDVEFELMLTVGLVVLVIFLFLRSLSATVIPSVAVPLSIVGTFAVMYLLGYSLNNLSLMALTISTGFVVDDAIVMIENISRFVEQGEEPLQAALKGAAQIGFTIISLTISLIAVLIPLLFMGDIVGRLFREFAVTLSVTILVSAVVSLTLTPMMSARILKHTPEDQQGRFYRASERAFNSAIGFYDRTLRWVLGHQTLVLLIAAGTLALTAILFMAIPKGFFPIQDTGVIQGISEAGQTVSFPAMSELQQKLAGVILKDPAVESLSSFIGIDGTNTTLNSGRIQINLKPIEQRKLDASAVIRRLQSSLSKERGIVLYMQPVQNLTVADRVSRTQFQYTLEDPNANELNPIASRMLAQLRKLPELADVASDQQNNGLRTSIVVDRNTAYRLGITATTIDNTLYDAYGQRQVSTMYTQLNQYHVVLELKPRLQQYPMDLSYLYIRSATGVSSAPATATAASGTGVVAGGVASVAGFGPSSGSVAAAANGNLTGISTFTPTSSSTSTTAPAAGSAASSSTGTAPSTSVSTTASSSGTIASSTATSSTVATAASTSYSGGSPPAGGSSGNFSGAPIPSSLVFRNGSQAPLNAFSRVLETNVPLTVNRQGQFPVVTLSFNLAPRASLGEALNAVNKVKDQMKLPASVQAGFQGTAQAFEASLANEPVLILAAVITVYIVLGVLYESYIHPLTILSTLPSAAIGALIALLLTGNDFSVIALIGLVLLIGIVKKNAIMMIDFALEAEREGGRTPVEAIHQACLLRFRPIMMTTMAALLGGVPLAFGSGYGSELRRPLGISIIGGLIFSQMLTLYTTPVIYVWFDRLGARFRRGRNRGPERGDAR
jgi:multidrug efflux pump